jgi:hypothetical protein
MTGTGVQSSSQTGGNVRHTLILVAICAAAISLATASAAPASGTEQAATDASPAASARPADHDLWHIHQQQNEALAASINESPIWSYDWRESSFEGCSPWYWTTYYGATVREIRCVWRWVGTNVHNVGQRTEEHYMVLGGRAYCRGTYWKHIAPRESGWIWATGVCDHFPPA